MTDLVLIKTNRCKGMTQLRAAASSVDLLCFCQAVVSKILLQKHIKCIQVAQLLYTQKKIHIYNVSTYFITLKLKVFICLKFLKPNQLSELSHALFIIMHKQQQVTQVKCSPEFFKLVQFQPFPLTTGVNTTVEQ